MASHRLEKAARSANYLSKLRDVIRSKSSPCPNCGERTGGCFMPPCFGDDGFFVCEKQDRRREDV